MAPGGLGVNTGSTLQVIEVEAPATRSAGIRVADVDELVDKLRNEARVI